MTHWEYACLFLATRPHYCRGLGGMQIGVLSISRVHVCIDICSPIHLEYMYGSVRCILNMDHSLKTAAYLPSNLSYLQLHLVEF